MDPFKCYTHWAFKILNAALSVFLITRLFYLFIFLHSHPDHFSTSSKCSGVDMNMARLLFHRVVQEEHPEITQQVRGRSTSAVGVKYASVYMYLQVLCIHGLCILYSFLLCQIHRCCQTFFSIVSNKLPQTVNPSPLCFH